jgi:small subunit ribosomal protein S16
MGAKRRPFYRLVAASSEAPRDGKFLEILGYYDPTKDPAVVKIDGDKVQHWISQGAAVSDAARAILKRQGFLKSLSTAE